MKQSTEPVAFEYTQRRLKLRFFLRRPPGTPYPHTWLKAQFLAMRTIASSASEVSMLENLCDAAWYDGWHFPPGVKIYLNDAAYHITGWLFLSNKKLLRME